MNHAVGQLAVKLWTQIQSDAIALSKAWAKYIDRQNWITTRGTKTAEARRGTANPTPPPFGSARLTRPQKGGRHGLSTCQLAARLASNPHSRTSKPHPAFPSRNAPPSYSTVICCGPSDIVYNIDRQSPERSMSSQKRLPPSFETRPGAQCGRAKRSLCRSANDRGTNGSMPRPSRARRGLPSSEPLDRKPGRGKESKPRTA